MYCKKKTFENFADQSRKAPLKILNEYINLRISDKYFQGFMAKLSVVLYEALKKSRIMSSAVLGLILRNNSGDCEHIRLGVNFHENSDPFPPEFETGLPGNSRELLEGF